jgi:hypothetical protein
MRGCAKPGWRAANRTGQSVTLIPAANAIPWPRTGRGVASAGRLIDEALALAYPGREQAAANEAVRASHADG